LVTVADAGCGRAEEVALTTHKRVRSCPGRSPESATRLAERFIAGVTKHARQRRTGMSALRTDIIDRTRAKPFLAPLPLRAPHTILHL
jgi:hypothetical protein